MATVEQGKELLMQFSYECKLNAEHAVKGYLESKNINVSLQFLNQAFQCIKLARYFYVKNFERGENQYFEDFYHQFSFFNEEFLTALETEHSLQASLQYFYDLESAYKELKDSMD